MGIENSLISMIKEVVLFDSFESLFLVLLFLIDIKQKVTIGKCIFHIFMLSLLNYFVSNLINIPILFQLIYIIIMSLYLAIIYKINIKQSLMINIKMLSIMFIFEMFIAISVMQYVFNINIINFTNDFDKFLFLLPVRIIESILTYGYYKLKNKKVKTIKKIA